MNAGSHEHHADERECEQRVVLPRRVARFAQEVIGEKGDHGDCRDEEQLEEDCESVEGKHRPERARLPQILDLMRADDHRERRHREKNEHCPLRRSLARTPADHWRDQKKRRADGEDDLRQHEDGVVPGHF